MEHNVVQLSGEATGSSQAELLAGKIVNLTRQLKQYGAQSSEPKAQMLALLAQNELLNTLTELQLEITNPALYVQSLVGPSNGVQASIQAICRLKIPDHIADDEEVSFEELTRRCGLDPRLELRPLLRLATAHSIFTEPRPGVLKHNKFSLTLLDRPFRDWIDHVTIELFPAFAHGIEGLLRFPGSSQVCEASYAVAHSNQSFWEVMSADDTRGKRFAEGMRYMHSLPHMNPRFLWTDLGWNSDAAFHVVEMGGSQGAVAKQVLHQFQRVRWIVQDLADVLETASVPHELDGRLTFESHSLLGVQPVNGADVYFVRAVLHNWSDIQAVQILRNLIPALKPGARVIVNEAVAPPPGLLPVLQEREFRGFDLTMQLLFNGKERSLEEWVHVFGQASPRYTFVRVACSPGSVMSVIEFSWS